MGREPLFFVCLVVIVKVERRTSVEVEIETTYLLHGR